MADTPEITRLAEGFRFPEAPVWLPNGDVLVSEIDRGHMTRVRPDGSTSTLADLGGGPNGAAIGPDGALYVCNNGGMICTEFGAMLIPLDIETGCNIPEGFDGGWIERVSLDTGESTVLYAECDGHKFRGPNDIVFDAHGGFWFTDLGKVDQRVEDRGGLYYGLADGSEVREVAYGLRGPNGVGLSPDGATVYVAETYTGRLLAWDVEGPGQTAGSHRIVVATDATFDSLAVEANGLVVVAAISHGLCVVDPTTGDHEFIPMPDRIVTNVAFGGEDLTTAYITMSATGWLGVMDWPRPGLPLAH